MNAKEVVDSFEILQAELSVILDPSTVERALGKARAEAIETEALYYEYCDRTDIVHPIVETGWGFEIKDPGLRFIKTVVKRYPFRVDIICDFRWKGEEACKRSVVLQVWALHEDMMYRPEWDSENTIGELVTSGALTERVMLRFHFDMAAEGAPEVRHHMQVAGVAEPGTYCWLHPQIEVPRFPYPPVDLFLICELVGANFYGQDYRKIRTGPVWTWQVRKSQEELLREYYLGCCQAIKEGKSLLMDHLWQR